MSSRLSGLWLSGLLALSAGLLATQFAHAGDPEAHRKATAESSAQIEKMYPAGVGATNLGNAQFFIPTDQATMELVNEPDKWECEQGTPEIARRNGARINPLAAFVFRQLADFDRDHVSCALAMSCNYSHFRSNPISDVRDLNTFEAARLTEEWARDILRDIANGRTENQYSRCDRASWAEYWKRVIFAAHYVQDGETEQHGKGNEVCGLFDFIAPWAPVGGQLRFADRRACGGYIAGQVGKAMVGKVPCDDEVVYQTGPILPNLLNPKALALTDVCTAGSALACMGLERLLRHHCWSETDRTVHCRGPKSDHCEPRNRDYCEGEECQGGVGGQDFMTVAVDATVKLMKQMAGEWASTCKQPDVPCVEEQCESWCKRVGSSGLCRTDTCTCSCVDPPPCLDGVCCGVDSGGSGGQTTSGDAGGDASIGDADVDGETGGESEPDGGVAVPTGSSEDASLATDGGVTLPSDEVTIGGDWGDPHVYTSDGTLYDFQYVGEFVLVTGDSGLVVQVRQKPYRGSKSISMIAAVAANVNGDRVEIDVASPESVLWVNGAAGFPGALPQGGSLGASSITWPDGTRLEVTRRGDYLDLHLWAKPGHLFRGLLGDKDGSTGDDIRLRDGTVVQKPLDKANWRTFAESWRISQAESLFHYGVGEDTTTFTDLAFPYSFATASTLAPAVYRAARATCIAAGITNEALLEACTLDTGVTGDTSYAVAASAIPPPLSASPAIYQFAVDDQSLSVDRVSASATLADGAADGVFDATIQGPLSALILLSTDARGAPSFGQQWDTLVTGQTAPPEIAAPYSSGAGTALIGVEENGTLLNHPDGSLDTLSPGVHHLKLYITNSGNLAVGQRFRLYAVLPNGSSLEGPILAYCAGECPAVGTSGNPGRSCDDILAMGDAVANGTYWVQTASDPFQVSCDMTTDGGGWTQLVSPVAAALDPAAQKTYLYLHNGRWYRSPVTTLSWDWSVGREELVGSYAYFDGSSVSTYVCAGSGEKPPFGVGCSNGVGSLSKTLPIYDKDPANGRCTVCQDVPFAFSTEPCQQGVAVFVR